MSRRCTCPVVAVVIACICGATSETRAEVEFRGPTDISPRKDVTYADFAFSPSGHLIAVVYPDGPSSGGGRAYHVGLLDRGTVELRSLARIEGLRVWGDAVMWSPDGEQLLVYGGEFGHRSATIDAQSGSVEFADRPHHGRVGPMWLSNEGHRTYPLFVEAYTALRRIVLQGGLDGTATRFVLDDAPYLGRRDDEMIEYHSLWHVDPPGEFMTLIVPKPEFRWIKMSPNGSFAVIGNHDDSIHVVRGDGSDLTRIAEGAPDVGVSIESAYVQWSCASDAFVYRTIEGGPTNDRPGDRLWLVEMVEPGSEEQHGSE